VSKYSSRLQQRMRVTSGCAIAACWILTIYYKMRCLHLVQIISTMDVEEPTVHDALSGEAPPAIHNTRRNSQIRKVLAGLVMFTTVVFLMLTGTAEVVCMVHTKSVPQEDLQKTTIDYIVKVTDPPVQNISYGCSSQNVMEIPASNKRVTVCTYQNKVRVDIRQFLNGHPTRIGLYLTPAEVNQLEALMSTIWLNIHRQNARLV
jgi:hypothetical protein